MRTLSMLPLCLLLACDTEPYEIIVECTGCCEDDTGDTDIDGVPIAAASHEVVELGFYCESTEGTFSISNTGDGVLTLDTPDITGDWTLISGATEVEPGQSVDIVVAPGSTGGSGTISFGTNDPNSPTISVALDAAANQAPGLVLGSIPPVIAPGAQELMEAQASDDESPAFLGVSWESDVDGVLDTTGADSTGLISHTWDGTLRTPGDHSVTLTATDSCGQVAQETFSVCQNEGYTEDNIDLKSWTFSGSSSWDATNAWLELTPDSRYQAGTVFMTSETVQSDNVYIAFQFYAGSKDSSGADGFSLTAIDTDRLTTYTGSNGGGIGYGSLPGWSIEVDTWDNTGDPGYTEPTTQEHISVVIDGASKGNGVAYAPIPNVEDGQWHDMEVEVIGQTVTVSIDGTVYLSQKVPEIASFPAHIGFTAATGSNYNKHLIDALEVEGFICDDEG